MIYFDYTQYTEEELLEFEAGGGLGVPGRPAGLELSVLPTGAVVESIVDPSTGYIIGSQASAPVTIGPWQTPIYKELWSESITTPVIQSVVNEKPVQEAIMDYKQTGQLNPDIIIALLVILIIITMIK